MAQAADSPIGFYPTTKVPDPDTSMPGDSSLAELHAWQASPAGLAEAQVAALASTIADLKELAAGPFGLRLLAAELPNLEAVASGIDQLLARLNGARGMPR